MDSTSPAFQNLDVDIHSLPHVRDANYHGLEHNYRIAQLLGGLLIWGILGIMLAVGTFFAPAHAWKLYAWVAFGGFSLISLMYRWVSFPYMRYALRDHDLIFEAGWLWKASTVIPFKRIQHCEVDQGFFERLYGLATLNIYTAGGSSSDLAVPGLTRDRAEQLRDFVIRDTPAMPHTSASEASPSAQPPEDAESGS